MWGRRANAELRLIDAYDLGAPEGWYQITLGETSPAWATGLAEGVTSGEAALRMAQMVLAVAQEVAQTDAFAAAVWVPELSDGTVHAAMGVSFVQPDPGVPFTPEQLGLAVRDSRPTTLEVLNREVNLMTLPAGESVVLREIVAQRPGGEVEERIVFTVFPEGASEALELAFASPHLESGEDLAAHAVAIAESLTVRLA